MIEPLLEANIPVTYVVDAGVGFVMEKVLVRYL